ncbi:MAG: hypothetical protein AB1490_08925 [Pseudomonadota bacterium]
MRPRRLLSQSPPKSQAKLYRLVVFPVLFFAMSLLIVPREATMPTAQALPAGFFFLQAVDAANAPLVMDVHDSAGRVSGFIHLRAPTPGKDSQMWKERFPSTGPIGKIRLENKATGQCLSYGIGNDAKATIRPCSAASTIWEKYSQGDNKAAFAQVDELHWPFPRLAGCLAESPAAPGFVSTLGCGEVDNYNGFIWHATRTPTGSVSSGLSEATPPQAPSNCKVVGAGGTCGSITLSCDPFAASNTIAIAGSGDIGAAVTDIEPGIGMVLGSYLNHGTASISVCAQRSGLSSCGNPIPNVAFGVRVCVQPPTRPRDCPAGERRCLGGACRPVSDRTCVPM